MGKQAGLEGQRTTLWSEFARIIGELRPRWVLAENVPGLLSSNSGRFFGNILRDLAARGYDAEWDCIPAAAVGAPHRRDRVFLVAYADSLPRRSVAADASDGAREATLADYDGKRCEPERYGYATQGVFGRSSLPRPAEWWQTEPRVCRVSDELSEGLDEYGYHERR